MRRLSFLAALVWSQSLRAAVVTSFDEAALPAAVLLDIPNASLGNVIFDATGDELDFTAAGNTDLWGSRNNAAIAYTAIPAGLVPGSVWTVETEVRINDATTGTQVAGITFYDGPNGARPDITFGLDVWDANNRAVRLQGLGDNDPNTALGVSTAVNRVFLRAVVQEQGATDIYNFYYKVNAGDAWQQIPGVAVNYATSFGNSRVGLTYKTGAAKAGAAFTFFNVQDITSTLPFVSSHPASLTVNEGSSATFAVSLSDATGASYRWQRNGVDISGATAASYTLNPATMADHNAQFRCRILNSFGGLISNTATLTVLDITPPVLQGASAPYSTTQVILVFNEPVDLTGASFTIAGGTVTNASVGPLPNMVTLSVSGLAGGAVYSVTANNVRNLAGLVLGSASTGFTAAPPPAPAPIELIRPAAEPIGPATRRGPFVLSEIHYHPRDRADLKNLEFIELYNSQPWQENLTGFRLTGEVSYEFPAGTTIAAGARLVIAAVPTDVQTAYSITGVLGPWTGSLNNSGGQLRLRDHSNAVVFEVDYDSGHPWQPAADGAGHSLVLARPSYGMKDARSWDISFNLDGTPGAAEPGTADPYRTVLINEVWPIGTDANDFVELYNYSAAVVDLSGCSLSDDRDLVKFVFPAPTSIPPGGFLAVPQAQLGFGLKAGGDTVYFRAPGSDDGPGRVADCIRFGPLPSSPGDYGSIGRYPDGSANIALLTDNSSGLPNDLRTLRGPVISEICYNPPPGAAQLPFIEITNGTGAQSDLSGGRLSGGVSYTIPAGTILANGAALAINAFSGSLNGGTGERIRLEMPTPGPDGTGTVYSVVDEVTYGTGGRWGRDSDGGGSSLEKKDLLSDGRLASNWADSSEPAEQGWVTVQATGVMDNGSGLAINRLHVMMLGAGECLVDDVEVFVGAGANVVTNPGFESGAANWLIQGTHDTSTVEAPGFSGGSCMHIRAAGRGDLAGNRLSVPLTTTLSAGATATIRAKVKWLRGHPEILLRLAGGVLEATGNILPPGYTPGTPGAANSTAVANAGPAIFDVTHRPVIPPANQTATVYAKLDDPGGIGLALLRYRLDPSATLNTVVMSYRGAGIFSAVIPAQLNGTLAAFTIAAYDSAGAVSAFPADGKECLIRWGEGNPAGSLGAYRLWMTQATRDAWTTRGKNSNTPLDVTMIYNNYRPIYNATAQYSGSPWHSGGFNGPTGNNCDYDCNVPDDDRLLGTTDFIFAGPGTFGDDSSFIREQTIWWIARHLGLQSIHRRFCRVWINGVQRQTVFEDTQQPNGDWIDEYWPGDNDGSLHKAQDWIEFADDGVTFGTTLRAFMTKRTTTGGVHKNATYRYQWAQRAVAGSANNWTPFNTLVDAFATGTSAVDPVFYNAFNPLVDQDSWMRALAIQRIAGNWDTWGYTYGKNMYIYKPTQGPWAMTAWDIDFSFGLVGDVATTGLEVSTQDSLVAKFRTHPAFRRAMWCAYREAVDGPMVPANVNAHIDRMVAGLSANSVGANAAQVTTVKNYITARRDYIITQLNAVYPGTTFALSGSSTITDADGILTLTGTAPPGVKTFLINGVEYTPTWTSQTAWSLPLTLYSASNALTVQGLGLRGNIVGTFNVNITVTGPTPLPPVTINEWMADNTSDSGFPDPADGQYEDWFELHNSGATPVNLGGFYLTDTTTNVNQFQIPAGTAIPAGGWLLIWADNEAVQNGITPGQLHTNFRLSASGEQIALYTPDGTLVDLINFGAQTTNQSQGRYPDSTAGIVSPVPTPGKRNALTPDIIAVVDAGAGVSTVTFSTEPTHIYQLESTTDLLTWTNWGAPLTAASAATNANLPRSDARRFWRARIVVP